MEGSFIKVQSSKFKVHGSKLKNDFENEALAKMFAV